MKQVGPKPAQKHSAFTLIELLAVVTLLSLMVGSLTVGLDGFTETGRLRSAANRIASLHQTARVQAVSSGTPRRLVFDDDGKTLRIEQPQIVGRQWQWTMGREVTLTDHVRLERVQTSGANPSDVRSVRIDADGKSPNYVCRLRTGKLNASAAINGKTGRLRSLTLHDSDMTTDENE